VAKISVRGCFELRRWKGREGRVILVRSDGKVLIKYNRSGYSILEARSRELAKTPAEWRKLAKVEQQRRLAVLDTLLQERCGYRPVECVVTLGSSVQQNSAGWERYWARKKQEDREALERYQREQAAKEANTLREI